MPVDICIDRRRACVEEGKDLRQAGVLIGRRGKLIGNLRQCVGSAPALIQDIELKPAAGPQPADRGRRNDEGKRFLFLGDDPP